MDFKELASKYKTPLYVYDFNYIKERYEALKNAFYARKSLVCYAVKANSNLSVLKFLADLGAGFDCVSIGEVKRALLAGAKRYQIIFSGVGKSDEELKEALENDIKIEKIDSNSIKIATDNNKSLDILKNISGNFIQELSDINIENISMDDVIRKIYQK